MSTTPSLVDVYHNAPPAAPHTGAMRVFVNGFGHDLPFAPADNGLQLRIDAIELQAAHLDALLQALREVECALPPGAATAQEAPDAPPAPSVQIVNHSTRSGLASGVVRLHAGTLKETDLPYHEHVSRNGRLVVQLHGVTLGVPLLAAILAAVRRDEVRLRKGREVFQRAASNLLIMTALEDGDGPP